MNEWMIYCLISSDFLFLIRIVMIHWSPLRENIACHPLNRFKAPTSICDRRDLVLLIEMWRNPSLTHQRTIFYNLTPYFPSTLTHLSLYAVMFLSLSSLTSLPLALLLAASNGVLDATADMKSSCASFQSNSAQHSLLLPTLDGKLW